MGRKVGDFLNPDTNEKDWFEVSTAPELALLPEEAVMIGSSEKLSFDFALASLDAKKEIALTASLKYNDQVFRSDPETMDELEFATKLCENTYSENEPDAMDWIQSSKIICIGKLSEKLLDEEAVINGTKFGGLIFDREAHKEFIEELPEEKRNALSEKLFIKNTNRKCDAGFINAKGKKIGTFESVTIDISASGTILMITLNDCITMATMARLIEPSITFYINGKVYSVSDYKLTNEMVVTGSIKDVEIQCDNAKLVIESEVSPEFEKLTYVKGNESSIANFIEKRMSLLDSEEEDSYDDFFESII